MMLSSCYEAPVAGEHRRELEIRSGGFPLRVDLVPIPAHGNDTRHAAKVLMICIGHPRPLEMRHRYSIVHVPVLQHRCDVLDRSSQIDSASDRRFSSHKAVWPARPDLLGSKNAMVEMHMAGMNSQEEIGIPSPFGELEKKASQSEKHSYVSVSRCPRRQAGYLGKLPTSSAKHVHLVTVSRLNLQPQRIIANHGERTCQAAIGTVGKDRSTGR